MKNVTSVLLIISVLFFLGCGEQKLTQEELEDNREEIRTLISKQGEAYASRDIEYFKNAVSDDIMEFGTTKEEVATNPEEWVEAFQEGFRSMDSVKVDFSEGLRHFSIQVSEIGDMATAIYEAPYKLVQEGKSYSGLFRMATTWRIVGT